MPENSRLSTPVNNVVEKTGVTKLKMPSKAAQTVASPALSRGRI
jgi:hypothetical protein